jgi:hypothetical protein
VGERERYLVVVLWFHLRGTGGWWREMIRFKDDPHGMERTKEEMLQRTIFERENKNSNGGRLAYP